MEENTRVLWGKAVFNLQVHWCWTAWHGPVSWSRTTNKTSLSPKPL